MNCLYIYTEIGDEMKRMIIVCALLVLATAVNAQREPRYKYNYTFKINVHTCPQNIIKDTFISTPGKSSFEIELKDCTNKSVPFVTVTIKGKDGVTKAGLTDSAGKAAFGTIPGTYLTVISAIGFEELTKTITVNNDSTRYIAMTLAYSKPLVIYDIHSKTPLPVKKIEEIKACLEENSSNPFKCSVKNAYFIMIEI